MNKCGTFSGLILWSHTDKKHWKNLLDNGSDAQSNNCQGGKGS